MNMLPLSMRPPPTIENDNESKDVSPAEAANGMIHRDFRCALHPGQIFRWLSVVIAWVEVSADRGDHAAGLGQVHPPLCEQTRRAGAAGLRRSWR